MPRIRESTIALHRQRIEAALIDSLGALMAEHGFGDITLGMVAERAGVARNTVYGYFPDKTHLLLAYVQREVEGFVHRVRVAIDATTGAEQRLSLLVEHLLRYFADGPGPHVEISALMGPESYAQFFASFEPVRLLLVRVIREGVHEGVFATTDPEASSALVHAAIGAFRIPVSTGAIPAETAIDLTLRFVLGGLRGASA
jgi:AcrR family transcriptional regulator